MTKDIQADCLSFARPLIPKGTDIFTLNRGCLTAIHKAVGEHAGLDIGGGDVDSTDAVILGDAHVLPIVADMLGFERLGSTLECIL